METGLKKWGPQLFLSATQWEVVQSLSKTEFSIQLSLKTKDGGSGPNLPPARAPSARTYRCTVSSSTCEELLKPCHFGKEESVFISLERDITVVWTRQQSLRRSLSVFQLFLREYFNLQSFLFFHSCCMKKFAPRGNSSFPHQFWSVLKLNLSASNLWTEHCHIEIKCKIKVKNECVFSPWLLHLFFICLDNFFQLLQLHKERIHIRNNLTMFYLYF